MKLQLDLQRASGEPGPSEHEIRSWVLATLATPGAVAEEIEVSIRLVDVAEMAQLNENFRGKCGATNVLSFPANLPPELKVPLLGDVVICMPIVVDEALAQNKTATAHCAHMTVHGILHLLGYDHTNELEAAEMESLESTILRRLDFPCPYNIQNTLQQVAK